VSESIAFTPARNGILAGLRVVEASAFVAAPLGGMTLAQMGADVIRIDPLAGGLDYRRWPVTAKNVSLFWCGLNKSKRSVTLDLDSAEGRDIGMALITAPGEDAGLLVSNFPPRGWLAHESLAKRRADLIQVTLMGDRNGASAVDYTINPRLGLPFITGPKDSSEPVNHVLPAWDLVTGQMIAVGLLAAERYRRRTALGQHVKLALEDVALGVMGHLGFIAEAQLAQAGLMERRVRYGNELFGTFGRDFQCADGERLMIVGLTLKQWRSLCEATDLTLALAEVESRLQLDFGTEGNRFRAREEIAALICPWIGARTLADVSSAFDRHGVCWGRYQSLEQLITEDASCSTSNSLFSAINQPGVGEILTPGIPLNFSGVARQVPQAAPQLGAHTEEVLYELLGITQSEFGRLYDRGLAGKAQLVP
jgi:2-methylfumaryl-CoA isomerase